MFVCKLFLFTLFTDKSFKVIFRTCEIHTALLTPESVAYLKPILMRLGEIRKRETQILQLRIFKGKFSLRDI